MKSAWIAFLCSGVCGAALAGSAATAEPATELAAAMRLDAFIAQLTNQMAASVNQKRLKADQPVPCIIPFTAGDFRDDVPRLLEKLFTGEEIARALKFYRSRDGQRYVEFTFEFLDSRAAGRQPDFELSGHEQASLKAFKRTRAGALMSSPLRIAGSNAARQVLREQYSAVPVRCPQPERA